MDCIFCNILDGTIPAHEVWEDDRFLAFLDVNPLNPGHTLVIPKRHADDAFGLPDGEFSDLLLRAKALAPALREATGAKRIGLAIEGFGVPHAHVHLVPINAGHELDPNRAKPARPEELERMREAIVRALKTA